MSVDLIILETFGYLEELHQALLAVRDVAPEIQVVAQTTIDEEGNCLDGASAETFAAKFDAWGADVLGCNCSVGPVAMLEAIERIRRVTDKPLSAQPNAGIPRNVEGRNIYLCSPEYMASYARKFVNAGVGLVGGCCGTTPEHTKAMKSALRASDIKGRTSSYQVMSERQRETNQAPAALAKRSGLGKKLAMGEFATLVEIVPLGPVPTFDATVEGTHNFVANGVIAHNSLEQDADVVLFIYRDEVYHPDSPDRGTAEVILSKHRNGPTGLTQLAFLEHYTRFANMARV